jgi:hypothetical protein
MMLVQQSAGAACRWCNMMQVKHGACSLCTGAAWISWSMVLVLYDARAVGRLCSMVLVRMALVQHDNVAAKCLRSLALVQHGAGAAW